MPEDKIIILNPPKAGETCHVNTVNDTPTPRPKLTRSEQSRINVARSRGPKTPRGKGVSCMNRLQHGRYMKHPTPIDIEDSTYYPEFPQAYIQRLKPADLVERQLVAEIAALDWRLNRSAAFESSSIDIQFRLEHASTDDEVRELTRATTAMRQLVDGSNLPAFLVHQQESRIRSRKAVYETLFRLRQAQPSPKQTQMSNDSLDIDPESEPMPDPPAAGPNQGPDRSEPGPDPSEALAA